MTTDSGDAKRSRRAVMPFVAYAIVLASISWAGVAFWTAGRGNLPNLPGIDRVSTADRRAAPIEPSRVEPSPIEPSPAAQGLKLPPRPAAPEARVPTPQRPAQAPPLVPSPSPPASSPAEAGNSAPAAAPVEKPEPPKTVCPAAAGSWPTEKTDQGKAIQGLLRDLGLYDGTVYGTVGPTTRAAIRKFQLSTGQAETGEPDEALFDSLKKKCASPG